MEDLTTLNSLGLKVIARFILLIFLFAVMAIGISEVFFPVLSIGGYEDSFDFATILNLFLSAVPKNIITPFAEGNVLQVVILAFLIGAAVVSLSERVINLKKFINESKFTVFKIMDMVLKIIPATIFLCIFQTIMTSDFTEIENAWKVVLADYLEFILMSVINSLCE
jgi:Na+/H+-dicarboxylate symporter